MKDIRVPIISGLSIAATLALIPSQALAEKASATVTTNGAPGTFMQPASTGRAAFRVKQALTELLIII